MSDVFLYLVDNYHIKHKTNPPLTTPGLNAAGTHSAEDSAVNPIHLPQERMSKRVSELAVRRMDAHTFDE